MSSAVVLSGMSGRDLPAQNVARPASRAVTDWSAVDEVLGAHVVAVRAMNVVSGGVLEQLIVEVLELRVGRRSQASNAIPERNTSDTKQRN